MNFRSSFLEALGPFLAFALPLILVTIAALYPLAHSSRRRLSAAAFMVAAALGFLALSAAVAVWRIGGEGETRTLRAAGQLVAAFAAINAAGVLLFDILLPRLRVNLSALARDLILAAAYAMGILAGLGAAGVNLGGLLATSAVMTAILAFSLQDTLGNVLGGMVLQLEQTLKPGDWVRVGNDEGVVREIRWRQTQIATASGDVLVVPNSLLMKGVVVALGRRDGSRRRCSFSFTVPLLWNPGEVIAAVEAALREDLPPYVEAQPAPAVIVTELLEGRASYAVRLWVSDLAKDADALSAARERAYCALSRAGIRLAVEPAQFVSFEDGRVVRERREAEQSAQRLAALRRVDLFATLTADELAILAGRMSRAPYARGETITRQGAIGHWLYIVSKGEAEVRLQQGVGAERVARLRAGDYMGEMALLTGAPRVATVVALENFECYRLDADAFRDVLSRRPDAAESVARRLAERRAGLESARGALDTRNQESLHAASADLLSRIRRFFALP